MPYLFFKTSLELKKIVGSAKAGYFHLTHKNRFSAIRTVCRKAEAFFCAMLALFTILSGTLQSSVSQKKLILGTATEGGNYFRLGTSMESICDSTGEIALDMIATLGSVDNILKLQSGEIDVAIVQNDIAFFAENGLYPFTEKIRDLTGIMAFYPEPVFLISNNPDIHILKKAIEWLLGIKSRKSGSAFYKNTNSEHN